MTRKAKLLLHDIALQMSSESQSMIGVGLVLMRKAARLEQLAELMSDEQAEICMAGMLAEGLVEMKEGRAGLTKRGAADQEEPLFVAVTKGGDA
jgi:hypothetical protein